jgi:hypothetical protein
MQRVAEDVVLVICNILRQMRGNRQQIPKLKSTYAEVWSSPMCLALSSPVHDYTSLPIKTWV